MHSWRDRWLQHWAFFFLFFSFLFFLFPRQIADCKCLTTFTYETIRRPPWRWARRTSWRLRRDESLNVMQSCDFLTCEPQRVRSTQISLSRCISLHRYSLCISWLEHITSLVAKINLETWEMLSRTFRFFLTARDLTARLTESQKLHAQRHSVSTRRSVYSMGRNRLKRLLQSKFVGGYDNFHRGCWGSCVFFSLPSRPVRPALAGGRLVLLCCAHRWQTITVRKKGSRLKHTSAAHSFNLPACLCCCLSARCVHTTAVMIHSV